MKTALFSNGYAYTNKDADCVIVVGDYKGEKTYQFFGFVEGNFIKCKLFANEKTKETQPDLTFNDKNTGLSISVWKTQKDNLKYFSVSAEIREKRFGAEKSDIPKNDEGEDMPF